VGDGFPSLVETQSGRHLIMKLSGVGQGPAGLATEFIATHATQLVAAADTLQDLCVGDRVVFETGPSPKKPDRLEARNVRVLN